MHEIAYRLPLVDALHIRSFSPETANAFEITKPIQMTVLTCTSNRPQQVNIVDAASLEEDASADFAQHYQEILTGTCGAWKLVLAQVDIDAVALRYYNSESQIADWVLLKLDGTEIHNLDLQLEVPHDDSRAPTKYIIRISRQSSEKIVHTSVDVYLPNQKKTFMFSSNNLHEFTVTERTDL